MTEPNLRPNDSSADSKHGMLWEKSASLQRRLMCMVYEAMMLFGVVFFAALLFATLLQQKHALYLRGALQDCLFVVLGVYFCWFWTHGGQTLPMKTWRIRLVTTQGLPVSWPRAVLRYVLVWLWFLPGLAAARWLDVHGWMLVLLPSLNFVLWAAAVWLHRDRQFLHDRLCRTRLVTVPVAQKPNAQKPDQLDPEQPESA